MEENPWKTHLGKMTDDEFLETLDDYGSGRYVEHEAAKRIRRLKRKLLQQKDAADGSYNGDKATRTYSGDYCPYCGQEKIDG